MATRFDHCSFPHLPLCNKDTIFMPFTTGQNFEHFDWCWSSFAVSCLLEYGKALSLKVALNIIFTTRWDVSQFNLPGREPTQTLDTNGLFDISNYIWWISWLHQAFPHCHKSSTHCKSSVMKINSIFLQGQHSCKLCLQQKFYSWEMKHWLWVQLINHICYWTSFLIRVAGWKSSLGRTDTVLFVCKDLPLKVFGS